MIAALREWLLGVAACAAAAALSRELAGEGAAKEAVRFAGGLLVLLALLAPLASAQLPEVTLSVENVQTQEAHYREVQHQALANDIAQRTQAYIEDKARGMGLSVRAEVTLTQDAVPLPSRVLLHGTYSAALTQVLTQELGLEQGSVIWKEND